MKELIYKTLHEKKYKLTPARKQIINIFLHFDNQLINATELYQFIRKDNQKINFSTIYRNLEVLLECNLLEKLQFENGTRYKLSKSDSHGHHLICKLCHKTEPIPYCPILELESSLKDSGFLPTEHRLEIYGYCKVCRGLNH